MTTLKEAVTSSASTNHLFQTTKYSLGYVAYYEGEFWLFSIYGDNGWKERKPYKGHIQDLSICSWTAAASLIGKIPFKVRLLPCDEEHLFMSPDEVIRRYGDQ